VTLTATVSPATATGTVTFKDGTTTLGTGAVSSGTATFSTAALAVGSHSLTAAYGGSVSFGGSNGSLTYVVNQAPSTTTVASSPASPSVFGQSVTFTATVAPSTATGIVTFKDGATTLGTGNVTAGKATFVSTSLAVGSHAVTATYGGDTNFTGSTGSETFVVNQAATSSTLTSSANPSGPGASVTFTDTVATVAPGAGTPTGTVTFSDGVTNLGPATISAGKATFTTSTLAVGSHPITAVYGGSTNLTGSTSNTVTQVVALSSTVTTVTSSANPSGPGASVTFTAAVAPATATGTVTFKDGTTTLGTTTLNAAGQGTFTTSTLAIGTHPITATYGGSSAFTGSTSAILNQVVGKFATVLVGTPQIKLSPLGIILPSVQATLKTSTGAPLAGQSIRFTAGSTVLCTAVTNAAGVATCTPPLLDEVNIILNLGVNESFAGTATYQASSSKTFIIG
jgi:hypothetical protein